MGSFVSKNQSATPKVIENELAAEMVNEISTTDVSIGEEVESNNLPIAQTPLTKTIATHLNRIAQNDFNKNATFTTPSYLIRKKILHDLGYTYSEGETSQFDPRSPSYRIPRTPLNLVEGDSFQNKCSIEYNGSFEDKSCETFSEKLENITLDNSDLIQTSSDLEPKNQKGEFTESLCSEVEVGRGLQSSIEIETAKTSELNSNHKTNNMMRKQDDSKTNLYVTPSIVGSGRIPLSVINRRGRPHEATPHSLKDHAEFNTGKEQTPDLHNENTHSAQRPKGSSKIPIYFKK